MTSGCGVTGSFGEFPRWSNCGTVPIGSPRGATVSSHILFDLSRPVDSDGSLPGPGGLLAGELSLFFTC